VSPSLWTSGRTTSWRWDTQNLFKPPPAPTFTPASSSETPSFAREGK